jgi:hypothetical protein
MLTLALSCILVGAVVLYLHLRAKFRPMMMLSEKIPGPKLLPVVGNALDFGFKTEGQLYWLLCVIVCYCWFRNLVSLYRCSVTQQLLTGLLVAFILLAAVPCSLLFKFLC